MPRRPRHCIPGVPLHIVQRGINRQDCFRSSQDHRAYKAALEEVASEYSLAVHAYVLMTNHVHLLVTPQDESGASRMMQQLGRKYVSFFNKKYERTGSLWEGRFRSSMINSLRYLFACHRYIELNPVRAAMVDLPHQYPWSSYRHNALGKRDALITPHREVLMLADTLQGRCMSYRRLFDAITDDLNDDIRTACRKSITLE